ncbi:MAG: FmdE family protein [bacterium]
MNGEEIIQTEDFKRCIQFHGHLCPGLCIGYRAAAAGMERLRELRAADEELVAIVENDACGADAVQVLAGCTFGKGNFIFRDYGKQVFTFISRESGQAVRLSLKPDAFKIDERQQALREKMRNRSITPDENREYWKKHHEKVIAILEKPLEELFTVAQVKVEIPPTARSRASEPCARCGEPTMVTKLEEADGGKVCGDCLSKPGFFKK